jgi:antitoxin component of MazEF toxin-antitoxin module
VFSDKRQNRRLISVLRGLADSALSVTHPNPYLHASLVDYSDGSSYDVWVTNNTSVLIVPKRRASAASLERVCNHICEEFEEGHVGEVGC